MSTGLAANLQYARWRPRLSLLRSGEFVILFGEELAHGWWRNALPAGIAGQTAETAAFNIVYGMWGLMFILRRCLRARFKLSPSGTSPYRRTAFYFAPHSVGALAAGVHRVSCSAIFDLRRLMRIMFNKAVVMMKTCKCPASTHHWGVIWRIIVFVLKTGPRRHRRWGLGRVRSVNHGDCYHR